MTVVRSILVSICVFFAEHIFANPWAQVSGPTEGPSFSIGETNAGCISGAATLPSEGEGYVAMHLERHRYFGHPILVHTIQALGKKAASGIGILHIGDLGMARGGPMPFGHRSHQSGLDADVWFDFNPTLHVRADRFRSNVTAPSLLLNASKGLNYKLWNDGHIEILKAAAQSPAVDRIFVNAYIKQELCQSIVEDKGWLHKIRPWYHHDDHFHMRLACPPDSPSCIRQKPLPIGDGCDENLTWWFHHEPAPTTKPSEPKPIMPSACRSVLKEY